ncbi:MAG TPA: hypothetical protein VEB43_13400 [Anaeromyxobacter sp.]|nr:hypothetical protein [Anaeromyxobacter sp.]
MADPIETKLVDKRVAHRYVRKGILDEKEWEKHLKGLPDLADKALPLEAEMDGDELDDEELEEPQAPAGPTAPA